MKPLLSNDLALDVSIENMLMQVGNKPERVVQFYKYNQIRSSIEISNILDNANKIYVTADYHLNKPKRIMEGIPKKIHERHNSVVTDKDAFLFLGDLGDPEYPLPKNYIKNYINSLNGIKIMILGNNDVKNINYYKSLGFDYVIQSLKYKDVIFTHFPYETDLVNIHGHIHGAGCYLNVPFNKHRDCYIDNNNFFPYEINYLRNIKYKGINAKSRPINECYEKEMIYLDNELEKNIDDLILNEATVVNKFKQTMTLYNADTRPAEVLYPRHPSAGNRIDKQSGDAVFFFSTQEEAIKYVVGKGLIKEYIDFCSDMNKEIKKIEQTDPEKAKRIRFYIAQINKFTEDGKYPPVFRKIGVHMKYFGLDDAKVFPEFPFCRMFIERASRSTRPCYIRICNVPTADIKHGHCANYKEFTVFKPCKVDKMLTFTLGQLFSKVPVKYFNQYDDFKKFLPTICKNFDKDLFRGLISYPNFRKRLQWSDGKTSHEKLNNIDTGEVKTESYVPYCELYDLLEENEISDAFKKGAKNGAKIGTAAGVGFSGLGYINGRKNAVIPKGAKGKIAAGIVAAGGTAAGAIAGGTTGATKALIQKHRAKKAKEIAVEEGVSLEEALVYVLECEQELLNEGYLLEDIYNEKVFSDVKQKYDDFKEKHKDKIQAAKDYGKLAYDGAKDGVKNAALAYGLGTAVRQTKLGKKLQDGKLTGWLADQKGIGAPNKKAMTAKGLAGAAAFGAGTSVALGALQSYVAKKARDQEQKENKPVDEDTLYEIALNCEEELLDDGYSLVEIYGESFDDSIEEFDIDDNVEHLTDAVVATYMDWQQNKFGKKVNSYYKKKRDKVRAKVKAGKPLNKQEQELWDRMQAIQSKRVATLRANKAAKKNNN